VFLRAAICLMFVYRRLAVDPFLSTKASKQIRDRAPLERSLWVGALLRQPFPQDTQGRWGATRFGRRPGIPETGLLLLYHRTQVAFTLSSGKLPRVVGTSTSALRCSR
jgi:hypothetical protein